MNITVNGEQIPLKDTCNIRVLLARLQITGRLAVEVNGEIVPRSQYAAHRLNDGDRVEVVRAIGGG